MGVEVGLTSNGTTQNLRVKQISADTEDVDTGGLFISTIFWGLSGVHTPALNSLEQDGYTRHIMVSIVAIYVHV
jgi:hypothetical protein